MITHSLGELDVIFPLFAAVKAKYVVDIEIIFAVKKIYNQIMNDEIPIQAYANSKNKNSANIFPYIYLCRILKEKFL